MRSDIRRLDVIGTVQHQFSPRLSSSVNSTKPRVSPHADQVSYRP